MASVLDNYTGEASKKLVYLILANHANDEGVCWPSVDTIAAQSNLSRRQTFRRIAELRKEGLVQVKKRREQSSLYNVLTCVSDADDTYVSVTDVTQNRKEYKDRVTKESNTSSDTSAKSFDEFWSQYPRKTAKGSARKAYATALKKVEADTLLTALCAFPFSDDPRYIPHPATWLNQERWSDEHDQTCSLPDDTFLA